MLSDFRATGTKEEHDTFEDLRGRLGTAHSAVISRPGHMDATTTAFKQETGVDRLKQKAYMDAFGCVGTIGPLLAIDCALRAQPRFAPQEGSKSRPVVPGPHWEGAAAGAGHLSPFRLGTSDERARLGYGGKYAFGVMRMRQRMSTYHRAGDSGVG